MKPSDNRQRRAQRSLLSVPATSPHLFVKAARSEADSVFLDLEDSVPRESKQPARATVVQAVNEVDWGRKMVGLRINALDTEWGLRDIIDTVSLCSRLDFVLLPRVERPFDLQHVDALLRSLEKEFNRASPVAIQAIIETPLGLANVEAIAATAPGRLEALAFGRGDFSINMETYDSVVSATVQEWPYALARIATACRAYGLRAIDGPFTRYSDLQGLRKGAILAASHGFEGKWVIHPSQIAPCNEVFSPSAAHLEWARGVLQSMQEATAAGRGAVSRGGELLDMAHVRLANKILDRAAPYPEPTAD
jgi:malyl-CoA/(S)-citramalyl-CoA lyase